MALAELGRRIAVELQRQRQRRLGVRQHRGVAGCRGRGLGDAAHADRMMVAAGQQRLPRRRAQRRGVEPGVLQPARGQLLEVGRLARPAEGAAGAEADVVDQDDQHVGRALGRPHIPDRRIAGVRILRVIGRQADMRDIGNRKDSPGNLGIGHGSRLPLAASRPPLRLGGKPGGDWRSHGTPCRTPRAHDLGKVLDRARCGKGLTLPHK